MPGLTVTEKQHWKERIARRIDKRIETIGAKEPNLMDRISRIGRQKALESLGLADMQAELDAIEEQEKEIERRQAIVDLCELLGVEMTAERRAYLGALLLSELEELRQHLKQQRAWPQR